MVSKSTPSHPGLGLQVQQNHALAQRLIMSAHMQQAIHLLQVPLIELESFIQEQVTQNPVLEISEEGPSPEMDQEEREEEPAAEQEVVIDEEDFSILKNLEEDWRDHFMENQDFSMKRSTEEEKYKNYLENSICAEVSLYHQLIQQARESFENSSDIEIAEILIGYIDEWGFLKTPHEEIASLHNLDKENLQRVLKEIQLFEPYGVGASSVQECLLIQLKCLKKQNTLAYHIVDQHYTELLHNRILAIQKGLGCSLEDIQHAIEHDIAKLDLHPGTRFSKRQAQPLIPDVFLRQEDDQLIVDVNQDYIPNLRLNSQYFKLLDDPKTSSETKQFIRHHVFSARWLARNLQQRCSTIERIAKSLAKRQYEFFTNPVGKLIPLTMKMLAEELNVHESTIARTVSNKYIDSPRGLFPLRAFFTTEYLSESGEALSSKTVQEAILDLIEEEDKRHPLSDEKISQLLKEKGIPCARRTVAKHRALLNKGNTLQRKKF